MQLGHVENKWIFSSVIKIQVEQRKSENQGKPCVVGLTQKDRSHNILRYVGTKSNCVHLYFLVYKFVGETEFST